MIKIHFKKYQLAAIPVLLFFFFFPSSVGAQASGEDIAVTVTLKKNAVVRGEKIALSDIATVDLNEAFKAARENIEKIEIGISPQPFIDRRITANEVKTAILKKIKLPENAGISMTGEPACSVKYLEREDLKTFKAEMKKTLEEKICELFRKDFKEKFSIAEGDILEAGIISGINDELFKKITATGEVTISVSAYKAGMATISIKTGGPEQKIPVKISKRSTVVKSIARIKKGTPINMEQLRSEGAVLPPEKFCEFITSEAELIKELNDNDTELIKDILPNESIRKIYFKKKQLINAGQKILLSVSNNNSIITFDAIAEGGGAIGDEISAVNTKTRRKYRVRITGTGTASAL